jgi:hypothetical protein
MPPVDFGHETLVRLQRSLGVDSAWTAEGAPHWSFWGTLQRAWSSPLSTSDRPTWRVHLHTRLLDGFTGAVAQTSALSSCLPHASLAAVVRGHRRPETLELASTIDVHDGNVGSMVRLLAVAARAQVAEARFLVSCSKTLASVGLFAAADIAAGIPAAMLNPDQLLVREIRAESSGRLWFQPEIAMCVDTLRQQCAVRAMQTPWGVSAVFSAETSDVRSVLEINTDGGRPLLGTGISVSLWTPVRGGPPEALIWNEDEVVSTTDSCHALGGWWTPEGGFLVHRSFYPLGVCHQDLVSQFLLAYARRAHKANAFAAGPNSA